MYFTGIAANHIKESSVKNHELAVKLTDAHVVRVLRRPVIRPDVQLLRLAIVAEGGD